MLGELDHGKLAFCLLRMIDFLAGCPLINLKCTVLARRGMRPIGYVASRWRFSSKSAVSVFISILVEHLLKHHHMSGSISQFWVWRCQIHGRDCLVRSGAWSRAMFCPVIKTISFSRWMLDFNSDR